MECWRKLKTNRVLFIKPLENKSVKIEVTVVKNEMKTGNGT